MDLGRSPEAPAKPGLLSFFTNLVKRSSQGCAKGYKFQCADDASLRRFLLDDPHLLDGAGLRYFAFGSVAGMVGFMRKRILAVAFAVAFAAAPASALADPDFGPGNSSKGPHDPGAKCHPPGQTDDFPACK